MKPKTNSDTPHLLQLLFIIGIFIMMLSQALILVYQTVLYSQPGASFDTVGTNIWYIAQSTGIPLVILIAVHLSRRDRKLSVNSLFHSLLLTTTAFMIFTAINIIFYPLMTFMPNPGESASAGFWWYTLLTVAVPLTIIACGLVLTILYLRRRKQW